MRRAIIFCCMLAPQFVTAAIVARSLSWREVYEFTSDGHYLNHIDLDGDGQRDFYTSTAQGMATIIPDGNNRVLAIDERPPDLGWSILPLTAGELIGEASTVLGNWRGLADRVNEFHLGGAFIYQCVVVGAGMPVCISLIEDGDVVNYVGLELERDGETRYGWIALGTPVLFGTHTVDVYAWAYETEPGVPIAAGAIPEPSVALLLIVGGALLLRRRGRFGRQVGDNTD